MRLTRIMHAAPLVGAFAACVLLINNAGVAAGRQEAQTDGLAALAQQAVSRDAAAAKQAIAKLRAAGPAGLQALLHANAAIIRGRASGEAGPADADGTWARVRKAIDAVAAQKDAHASGLYWHTELDTAKAAARESGKPILSLRLLGTLDTEFSCANSRFFRTALYANQDVSRALRERFVLHWKSVRPVPKVTIDFGDGRKVERTITGNSIHYVLDGEGRVIDALPGLYGPKAFLTLLDEAASVEKTARSMPREQREQFLRKWHGGRVTQILKDWQADLRAVGAVATAAAPPAARAEFARADAAPAAVRAAPLAVAKVAAEMPLVAAVDPTAKGRPTAAPPMGRPAPAAVAQFAEEGTLAAVAPATPNPAALASASSDETWKKLGALPKHAEDSRLDAGSRALMASKMPTAERAGRAAFAKAIVESPIVRVVRNFERAISEDTVRNEYTFHRQIHQWLAWGQDPSDVDALNERVYAELFLTPSTDPWLGLLPPDTYTALENDGFRQP